MFLLSRQLRIQSVFVEEIGFADLFVKLAQVKGVGGLLGSQAVHFGSRFQKLQQIALSDTHNFFGSLFV